MHSKNSKSNIMDMQLPGFENSEGTHQRNSAQMISKSKTTTIGEKKGSTVQWADEKKASLHGSHSFISERSSIKSLEEGGKSPESHQDLNSTKKRAGGLKVKKTSVFSDISKRLGSTESMNMDENTSSVPPNRKKANINQRATSLLILGDGDASDDSNKMIKSVNEQEKNLENKTIDIPLRIEGLREI